jgi:glycosyltransferase involved in cell wall biosynthesis
MRIAVVHPYPVHHKAVGGTTRVYELVRHLARRHDVSVFTHAAGETETDPELARLGVRSRTFPLRQPRLADKVRWWFDRTPYYVHRNLNMAMADAIAASDREQPFDVVHLELGYMAPAVDAVGPQAVRVLAEQEVMTLVVDRLRHVPWNQRTFYERMFVGTAAKVDAFDRRTLPAFDLLYGITATDRDQLRRASGRPAAVLPHVVRLTRFTPPGPGEEDPLRVLFVGNFGHAPNLHAVQWFVDRAWPLVVSHIPQATFEIVGAGLSDALARRFAGPGVIVRGYQTDLAACYRRASVVVTPIHSGGGMRGKVLEAFASARALVSTSTGLDGIAAESGTHCLVADTPGTFAGAVATYLRDHELRRAHGHAARALVADQYDAPVVFARLERDYEAAVAARRGQPARTTA